MDTIVKLMNFFIIFAATIGLCYAMNDMCDFAIEYGSMLTPGAIVSGILLSVVGFWLAFEIKSQL